MKVILISDTHCKHSEIDKYIRDQEADFLIHAGDGSNQKIPAINNNELRDCLTWMDSFDNIDHKIYVPGNHDTSFEKGLIHPTDFKNIDFLVNEYAEYTSENRTVKIYGSPISPTFGVGWAYNCKRQGIDKYWNLIPNDLDILITHSPPKGILDHTVDYGKLMESVGCKSLLNKVLEVKPKVHVFGHLHDEPNIFNHGIKTLGNDNQTRFINASIVNLRHEVVNKPIIIEI